MRIIPALRAFCKIIGKKNSFARSCFLFAFPYIDERLIRKSGHVINP